MKPRRWYDPDALALWDASEREGLDEDVVAVMRQAAESLNDSALQVEELEEELRLSRENEAM